MYQRHVGRDANQIALAHLQKYNLDWKNPIASEAWSKHPAPWGDQYSDFNAGEILLLLEGRTGLAHSIPQSRLTVCDSMPERWSLMELRIRRKVDDRMGWPKVLYRHKNQDGIVRKTISVSGNPLTHLRSQPSLEEGTVVSAPPGSATENQGRNQHGYHFREVPEAGVTITVTKGTIP